MRAKHIKTVGTQTRSLTRREFLAKSATAAAFSVIASGVLGDDATAPASERMNIAGIGVGGMGASNLANLRGQNIVALCDVDHNYAATTFKKYPKARVWSDYREMLEQQKDIDAVVIATPDHTHAVIALAAMQAGKHVYLQKPLTHDVFEARTLAEASRRYKVTTQMGNQGHSSESLRRICEWIWDGAIGEVREVQTWCDLTYYPWGHAYWSSKWGERPKDTPAVPATLNWDLWLGPACQRPYHPAYHPATWRCWWEFGCGMMGDRGAHTLDAAVWALKLGQPTTLCATTCGGNADVHPISSMVVYEFPARPNLPPVKLTWLEGLRAPWPEGLDEELELPREGGIIFHGTKGKLMAGVYGNRPQLLPAALDREYKRPAPSLPRVAGEGHELDWVRCAKAGKPAGSNFEYAGLLTEVCLLGNIAKRAEGPIHWDGTNLKVTNNEAANRLVRTEYRDGWKL
jgi:predicted dehydrogenase